MGRAGAYKVKVGKDGEVEVSLGKKVEPRPRIRHTTPRLGPLGPGLRTYPPVA